MYVHKQYLLEFIMQNGQIMIFPIYDLFNTLNTVIAIRKFMKMCEIMHIIIILCHFFAKIVRNQRILFFNVKCFHEIFFKLEKKTFHLSIEKYSVKPITDKQKG